MCWFTEVFPVIVLFLLLLRNIDTLHTLVDNDDEDQLSFSLYDKNSVAKKHP